MTSFLNCSFSGNSSGYSRKKYRKFCLFGGVFPVKVPAIAGKNTGTFIGVSRRQL